MKKIFSLLIICSIICPALIQAQNKENNVLTTQEDLLVRAKRIYKAPLVEKAKISEEKADKVVAIIAEIQGKMRELSNAQPSAGEDRMKKMEALREERDKKFRAIPLSEEEMKNVSATIDEIRKNMQSGARPGNN